MGGYWRFHPSVDLDLQASAFVSRVNAAPLALPPMVDVEDADGLPPAALTDWTIRALTLVRDHGRGQPPVLYTGQWFLANALEADRLTDWGLALAAWTANTSWPDPRAAFWQYAGDVTVPWSSGRVDLQRWRTS